MTASHRCLILTPTGEDGALIVEAFTSDGLVAHVCSDVPDLCRELREGVGAVVMAEEAVTASHAAEIRGHLDEEPAWSVVPFVLLMSAGEADDAHKIVDLFGAHATVALIERPCRTATLTSAVRVALSARERQYEIRSLLERLEEQTKDLKKTSDELLRSNADLDQFAAVASHDLQEPLRMIVSYVDLLKRKYGALFDERAEEYMKFITSGGQRMTGMIKGILEYSRLGHESTDMVFIESGTALSNAVANLDSKIADARATIVEEPLPRVMANVNQLTQVFQNLLSNAIKFFCNQRTCTIQVRADESESEWTFSVADNGIGMDPVNSSRIFQIFQRLHSVEQYPGTGIGLATCKKIVEHHGGRIWVESKPDVGSTFFFTLPKR